MTQSSHSVYLMAVGLAAPGLDGWDNSLSILRGETLWQYLEMERYKPEILPPNEQRRATATVRLALKASEEALTAIKKKNQDCINMATVFASSGGDYSVTDKICRALAKPEREVSPTDFHNSVHNASAGYWGIGTACKQASTSLSAFDASFATGLLEAMMMLREDQQSVLFAAYDSKPPFPLDKKRLISMPFACAFVVARRDSSLRKSMPDLAVLNISVESELSESQSNIVELEAMRLSNPAARCLPLLEKISLQQSGVLSFLLQGKHMLQVTVNY